MCRAGSVVALMEMVIFFWECSFPPFVEIRENPEFLMRMDKGNWPRCPLWHGWLPLLSGVNGFSLWAEVAADGAAHLLDCALGPYSSTVLAEDHTDGTWSLMRFRMPLLQALFFFFFCSSSWHSLGLPQVGTCGWHWA